MKHLKTLKDMPVYDRDGGIILESASGEMYECECGENMFIMDKPLRMRVPETCPHIRPNHETRNQTVITGLLASAHREAVYG